MIEEEWKEAIRHEREGYKTLYDAICKIQQKYCQKLQEENNDGNLASARECLEVVNDLQSLIDH